MGKICNENSPNSLWKLSIELCGKRQKNEITEVSQKEQRVHNFILHVYRSRNSPSRESKRRSRARHLSRSRRVNRAQCEPEPTFHDAFAEIFKLLQLNFKWFQFLDFRDLVVVDRFGTMFQIQLNFPVLTLHSGWEFGNEADLDEKKFASVRQMDNRKTGEVQCEMTEPRLGPGSDRSLIDHSRFLKNYRY